MNFNDLRLILLADWEPVQLVAMGAAIVVAASTAIVRREAK